MSEIIGHVDARDRSIISLARPDQEDSFLVAVDTGFNRQLLIHRSQAIALHCEFVDLAMAVELAGRERHMLEVARCQIVWFGRQREVEVLIGSGAPPRSALADEPVGLTGTSLLSPHQLIIDLTARRAVITEIKDQNKSR